MASAKQIPPGGEGSISVTFSTKNRSGKNVKHVKVTSNDSGQPVVVLEIKADLEALVALDPPTANFGSILRDKAVTQRIRLTGRDAAKTKILSVEPLARGAGATPLDETLDVRIVQAGEEGGPSIEVAVKPDPKPTLLRGVYEVKTDHPEVGSLRLNVTGRIRGVLNWRPERVHFANLEPGQPQQRTVVISGPSRSKREVTEVEAGHPSLSATFTRLDNGDTNVVVTCNGEIDKDAETATLRIRTSNPGMPVIEVPVTMRKKRAPVSRP